MKVGSGGTCCVTVEPGAQMKANMRKIKQENMETWMVQTLEKDVTLTTNLVGEENYTFPEDKSIKSTSCCFSLPSHIYIFTPIYRFCSTKVKTLIPLELV